jgi:hypothetical protein
MQQRVSAGVNSDICPMTVDLILVEKNLNRTLEGSGEADFICLIFNFGDSLHG